MPHSTDSVDQWLKNIGGEWSWYARVRNYNARHQAAAADTLLVSLADSARKNTTMYGMYMQLWNALSQTEAEYNGGAGLLLLNTLAGIDPTSVSSYSNTSISFSTGGIYKVEMNAADTAGETQTTTNTAAQLIWNTQNIHYRLPPVIKSPCLDGDVGKLRIGHQGQGQSAISNVNGEGPNMLLTVYPNPASGVVTFAYQLPEDAGAINITITNIVGEQMTTLVTGNGQGKIYWDTRNQPAGVYVYQASDANGIIKVGKLVVVK